ncbi:unnamed protein product [Owenia fusiformis]|uniref:Uncharacterized protein n=1 Tax=Owenia fusiformis TaxID=6347 RepID=A0A8J1TCV5_OWEFU|nr:unnamed protein product [Owenia fusiformis]
MFNSVTSWLGGTVSDEKEQEKQEKDTSKNDEKSTQQKIDNTEETPESEPSSTPGKEEGDTSDQKTDIPDDEIDQKAKIKHDIDEVSAAAVNTAKEWGSYLYSFGKEATKNVVETAKTLKSTVEEKTILGEFSKEQDKFVSENRERKKQSEAAVPPWVGYNEEETMKSQILALSQDKRNFLRNPPGGVQFTFEFDSAYPVAMATLQEDPNLQKMRFELVPKQIKEEPFWRNYFYRVSLIKQSTQLTSIAQQTGTTGEGSNGSRSSKDSSRRSSVDSSQKDKTSGQAIPKATGGKEDDADIAESPPQHEFVSDAFEDSQLNEDELRQEMQQLGMSDTADKKGKKEELPEWEQELQKELNEYEVVVDGDDLVDTELENEILQQIEAETKES